MLVFLSKGITPTTFCLSAATNASLAIIKDGKNMIGEKLFVMSPLKNKVIPVEIVSSHYVDPKGERVRS